MNEQPIISTNDLPNLHISQQTPDSSDIACHHCGSSNYNKAGVSRHGKRKYKCKNCNRCFTVNPAWKKLQTFGNFDFDSDVWSAEQLGLKAPLHRNDGKLNFAHIRQPWFKDSVKRFI